MMAESNCCSSSYISVAAYRYNSTFAARKYNNIGEWYYGGYNHGRVESESYNYYRDNDPDYVQNNYRMKPGQREPYANYGNWFFHTCGQSSSKMSMWADLRTGQVFHAQNPSIGNQGYVASMGTASPNGSMKRLRNSHN